MPEDDRGCPCLLGDADLYWDMVDLLERGEAISRKNLHRQAQLVIDATFLRRVLIGGDLLELLGCPGGDPCKNGCRCPRPRICKLTPAGVVLNPPEQEEASYPGIAGKQLETEHDLDRIKIESAARAVDFRNLGSRDGNGLPPLIWTRCDIEPEALDLSGSHLTSLSLRHCSLALLDAHGCRIEGECRLYGLQPAADTERCQVRLTEARIGGAVDIRKSRFCGLPVTGGLGLQKSWERYGLSMASAEIFGRVMLADELVINGGVSLYQARINNSLRIVGAQLNCADAASSGARDDDRRDPPALDAAELNLAGSLIWGHLGADEAERKFAWDISGIVLLKRARIGGDLHFECCRWKEGAPTANVPAVTPQPTPTGYAAWANGGIDARSITVEGQLRFSECTVGHRTSRPSGLAYCGIGPALDCWKGTFGRGARFERSVVFHGPVYLNNARFDRNVLFEAKIITGAQCPHAASCPGACHRSGTLRYEPVLDMTDARLEGHCLIQSDRIEGRVSLQRLEVNGAMDIHRLRLFAGFGIDDEKDTAILDLQDIRVSGGINLRRQAILLLRRCGSPAQGPEGDRERFVCDLRGLQCVSFDDGDGDAWIWDDDLQGLSDLEGTALDKIDSDLLRQGRGRNQPWRLRFDGITFQRLDRCNLRRTRAAVDPEKVNRSRTRNLTSFFNPDQRPLRTIGKQLRDVFSVQARALGRKLAFWRKSWAGDARLADRFSAQPFEEFARPYFNNGDRDLGVHLVRIKSDLAWRSRARDLGDKTAPYILCALAAAIILWLGHFSGLNLFGAAVIASSLTSVLALIPAGMVVTGRMYAVMFGYGLVPRRALSSFAIALALGVLGAWLAGPEHARWLILTTGQTVDPAQCPPSGTAPSDLAIYAADVFLPILDLRKECAFHAGDAHAWFEIVKDVYACIGLIVTSLTILTISGLLRRDIER